ncbi:MAG: hypothetical protein ACJA1A_000902 [Saprospiraceae bacterium]|jgi:hypothetical protein|tara:strand:- start:913 stop:2256 length:1344 start_codon:yes stop_codon:yes gene_type:complete
MQYRIIAFLLSFLVIAQISAQTNGNSPYSRYGIGDLVDENFLHLRGMGSLGSSYVDGYHINIVNPASLASLRATAFDIGLSATRSTLESGGLSSTAWHGNLQYLSLAFPLSNPLNEILNQKKRTYDLGMSFTLMPNSTVGYNITSKDTLAGIGEVNRSFTGNGGSYKFMWGNAIKYKNFSFGLNLGYLFGNIEYEQTITLSELPVAYQNLFSSKYNLKGFIWGVGGIYMNVLNQDKLNDKTTQEAKIFSLGIRIKNATSFNTSLTESKLGVQTPTSSTQFIDTVSISTDQAGSGKLPLELGLGASYYHGNKYMIGFDFSTANWSSYENDADPTLAKNPLKNTMNVSLGGYFRPNHRSYNRYFKRVYYRYGLYYKTDPRVVAGEQIDSYGVTFGFGLPFIYQRKISHANLGFEFGKKGSGSVIEETFFKINLGFTFNDDEWFVKRKYN